MRSAECGVEMEGRSSNDARPDIPHSTFRIPHSGRGGGGGGKIAVVFDTLHPEWDDAAYKKELEAKVEEAEYDVASALMAKGRDVRMRGPAEPLGGTLERLPGGQPERVVL